jgi:anti-sigma regulatory factor (Ser/Thr protein kinase)
VSLRLRRPAVLSLVRSIYTHGGVRRPQVIEVPVKAASMATASAFRHPALFYRGDEEYLAATVPFILEGLNGGEPVAVAVPGPKLALLRATLGRDADRVRLLNMTEVGRNPGRIIPGVLRAFADAHQTGRVRIIGEPIWPGRSAVEYPACVQHEALINMAFPGRPVTILCPYDVGGLDDVVLADAQLTHPVLIDATGERDSAGYAPADIVAAYNQPLPEPAAAATLSFDHASFPQVRRFAVEHARRAGLPARRIDDMALAVSELATNSIIHGGGAGTLRIWTADAQLVCEIADGGKLIDPLVGRRPVAPGSLGGRGMLLVNLVADLVRVHTGEAGTVIRVHLAYPPDRLATSIAEDHEAA